jgi:hypothetical protein
MRRCAIGTRPRLLPCCFQLLVLYKHKLVLTDLLAAPLLMDFDGRAGHGVHQLVAQAIAGASIDLPKGNAFSGADGWIKSDRTGDQ